MKDSIMIRIFCITFLIAVLASTLGFSADPVQSDPDDSESAEEPSQEITPTGEDPSDEQPGDVLKKKIIILPESDDEVEEESVEETEESGQTNKVEETELEKEPQGTLEESLQEDETISEESMEGEEIPKADTGESTEKQADTPTVTGEEGETGDGELESPESLEVTETPGDDGTAKKAEEIVEKIEEPVVEVIPLFVNSLTKINSGRNDSNPSWSPSGRLLAFERSIGDKREIIVSRLDGSIVQRIYSQPPEEDDEMEFLFPGIVDNISYNAGISWSPDETSLVYMSNGGSGNYDLYLLKKLGEKTTIRLTEHNEKDSHPHWAAMGNKIIFVSGRTGKADIFLMDLTTRETVKLTNGVKTYLYPQWSPDGKKIVMIYGSNENHDIYLIEDINNPINTIKALTTWTYDDLRPVWSPDGSKIAFYSNYNLENDQKRWSIIVIAADGNNPTAGDSLAEMVVSTDVIPDIERGPAWMADSKRIVYVKNDKRAYNPLYTVNIENKTKFRIKTDTKMNHDVVCSPDGNIAFRAQIEQWDHIYITKLDE